MAKRRGRDARGNSGSVAGNHRGIGDVANLLKFAREIALSIAKALILYLAGKMMKKYIPSSIVLLWLFLAAETRIGVMLFIAAYILVPFALSYVMREIWGHYALTNSE